MIFRIENTSSGCDLGLFEGDSPAAAFDALARAAGYADQAEAIAIAGPAELSAEVMPYWFADDGELWAEADPCRALDRAGELASVLLCEWRAMLDAVRLELADRGATFESSEPVEVPPLEAGELRARLAARRCAASPAFLRLIAEQFERVRRGER